MQIQQFPLLAFSLGLLLSVVVHLGARPGADGGTALPLFTLLIVAEFGFIVTAIGAFMAMKTTAASNPRVPAWITALACAALSLFFGLRGIALWPA